MQIKISKQEGLQINFNSTDEGMSYFMLSIIIIFSISVMVSR